MSAGAANVLSFRPIDELEATLLDSWREVSKVTHRFLVLLREFDLRQGWLQHQTSSRSARSTNSKRLYSTVGAKCPR